MTDPERLSEGGTDDERRLLGAARRYQPSRRGRETALAGLGLAGTVTTAGATSFFATLAGKAVVLGIGIVVAASAVGVAYVRPMRVVPLEVSPTPPVAPSTEGLAAARPVGTAAATEAPVVLPETVASGPPVPERSPQSTAVRPSPNASRPAPPPPQANAPEAPKDTAPSLAEAMRALDASRAALRAGRPQEALATMDAHATELARSPLATQAEVVRIEALAAAGDRTRAKSRAIAFLSAHPTGLLADRVRQLVPEVP